MQRSATGRTRDCAAQGSERTPPGARAAVLQKFSRGFTLIEVLVVVTIAAIVASLVVLRLGNWGSGTGPAEQLKRLAALIDYQCEQALFQSKPRGIRLTTEGFDFWQSTGQGWAPVPDDEVARPRAWRGEVELDLAVEERSIAIAEDPAAPQLVCQPLGELTDFDLALRVDGQTATLLGEPGGRLAVEASR